jgi:hypothetical protein
LAFCRYCTFRPHVTAALDRADLQWEMALDTDSDRTIEAAVSADLAVNAMIDGTEPPHMEKIDHDGALPELPIQLINLYGGMSGKNEVHDTLVTLLRNAFSAGHTARLRAV